jgi:hypothetical protein
MFAQHVPNGMSQVDAYARVSYSRNHGHASRLAALEPTRQRVAELQRRNVTRQDDVIAVTTDELQSMTRATYELAMEMARQAEALVAVMTLAKLSGLWVETTPRRGKIDPKMLSNEELMTLIASSRPDRIDPNSLSDQERAALFAAQRRASATKNGKNNVVHPHFGPSPVTRGMVR